MDVYLYQAAFYCADCTGKIQESLAANEIPGDESTYDSGEYPKGPYSDGGGEADSPQHCAECQCFLENPLTSDGYNYIQETLEAEIRKNSILEGWFEYYSFSVESSEAY